MPSDRYGGLSVDATSAADLSAARVATTQSEPPREYVLPMQNGSWTNLKSYQSLAEMDSDLPSNDRLVFSIEGGLLGAQTASMRVPAANLFSGNVPYLTSNAFTVLNGLDTTAAFNVTWDGFAQVAGTNGPLVFFTINRVSNNSQAFGNSFDTSAKSIEIPANTLMPNTAYEANLTYSSRIVNVDAGFGTGDSEVLFDLLTKMSFTTAALLPGDYNRDNTVDAADYTLWRDSFGDTGVSNYSGADGDGDGAITHLDYAVWKSNFGLVGGAAGGSQQPLPEPSPSLLFTSALLLRGSWRRLSPDSE